MNEFRLTTPVVFMIFNRPENTRQVFERIRAARPGRLLVVADGPRADHPEDNEKCSEARAMTEMVDWDCEVMRNYTPTNLGCKRRISSGIDWAFSLVDETIVLEDDCLPHPSFFRYCSELLDRYRNDERVVAISGDNFQFGRQWTDDSYYFSRYPHAWGWATWRRVWRHYDVAMKSWPQAQSEGWINQIFDDPRVADYWNCNFQSVYEGRIDTWDHQWTYACLRLNGLTALPRVNLISNIGFGAGATHTIRSSKFSRMPVEELQFPLQHPSDVTRLIAADRHTDQQNYSPGLFSRARRMLRRWLRD